MVVIRLARFGSKHSPRYRITVADSRRGQRGRFIEVLGFFNPQASESEVGLRVDSERAQSWILKGAQPSERVKSLLKKASSQPKA